MLLLGDFSLDTEALSMANEGRKEVFVDCVEDIEEELPLGNLLGEELIWEVLLYVGIALDHLEDLEHAQLL